MAETNKIAVTHHVRIDCWTMGRDPMVAKILERTITVELPVIPENPEELRSVIEASAKSRLDSLVAGDTCWRPRLSKVTLLPEEEARAEALQKAKTTPSAYQVWLQKYAPQGLARDRR
ncbi:MAG: hypothetical protein HY540_07895 [Deltaproteobacteria bacterium]|nr:hypothetical protein [Deltaproteobacteria bacterium]